MKRKIIDISVCIENEIASDPEGYRPKITYMNHKQTFPQIEPFFPGLKKDELPNGELWAVEKVELLTHNGTHLDAPYHFHSTMDKGKKSFTIDEVPLEWCFQNAIKLDFRHFEDGYLVTVKDIKDELKRINYEIKPLDIVLINTNAGKKYGQDGYIFSGCGMGYDATMYLLEKGVKLTGTDAWSWDAPFNYTAQRYKNEKDSSIIWEGHKAGKDIGYCHLEKLNNLEKLPSKDFMVSCFPVKIKAASAGWTRAVAILNEAD